MKTANDNILNVMSKKHRILIDNITEYDYNGDVAVVKKICTVVRYLNINGATPMIFNVSPYTGLMDMHTMARTWIDCGCPTWDGSANFPRKWTKENLQAWVAG